MEFQGRLDAESAALFEALLKPFEKPHSDVEGPDTRTWAERGRVRGCSTASSQLL
jgi:hypothetical protein